MVMKVNFRSFFQPCPDESLRVHAEYLSGLATSNSYGKYNKHPSSYTPTIRRLSEEDIAMMIEDNPIAQSVDNIRAYMTVDAIGDHFTFMNENFPIEQYSWFLWYESVFLVPEDMANFLILKWQLPQP